LQQLINGWWFGRYAAVGGYCVQWRNAHALHMNDEFHTLIEGIQHWSWRMD
jgi:hypothetical protein